MATQAEAGNLPRIGELIDGATGVKYDTYKGAQKSLGLEAAMAAIASNPDYRNPEGKDMAQVVDNLLLKQADMRMKAVESDMGKLLKGETLGGLNNSSFLMVKMADKAPAGLEATLERAREEVKDPQWQRAEGASNVTNFARDVLTTVSSASPEQKAGMTDEQKHALRDGVEAAQRISGALIEGRSMQEAEKQAMLHRLDRAMDTAIEVNPAIKKTAGYKQNYENYRPAMREGISNGIEATNQQVKAVSKTLEIDSTMGGAITASGDAHSASAAIAPAAMTASRKR